jgi:hypothetical protein
VDKLFHKRLALLVRVSGSSKQGFWLNKSYCRYNRILTFTVEKLVVSKKFSYNKGVGWPSLPKGANL